MKLGRLANIFALLLVCACAAEAQDSKCALKLAQLPTAAELRGFQPGMTIEQLKARLPKLRLPPADEFGFTAVNIFPDYEAWIDKAVFAGVRSISLEFLDGRLFSLWIGYDASFKWKNVDELVAGIAPQLNLPSAWQTKGRNRQLSCVDFQVAVIPVGQSPSIRISDDAARELLEKRKAEREEAPRP
ncbi:MAG TPA: hypothetical protein VF723_15115 [Pyrinomonadaceae bacterium]|jgi:hypothetical protein